MDDTQLVHRISQLADEEHTLERSHEGLGLSPDELVRLRAIEVAVDQCWDLLRQRRARRNSGQDPDAAEVRAAPTVEGVLFWCGLAGQRRCADTVLAGPPAQADVRANGREAERHASG